MPEVTVAIPVRNGAPTLRGVLEALGAQTVAHELLVCDSGSSDGSARVARCFGARVLEIDHASFSHGGTRNLLMAEAHGARVAMLTQDAQPADEHWLERLLSGFDLAGAPAVDNGLEHAVTSAPEGSAGTVSQGTSEAGAQRVGLVYGPYLPRMSVKPAVRWELEAWFRSLSADGKPRLDRLTPQERSLPVLELLGRRGFFTDANACISREAWSKVPFREVPYAEDRVLAIDTLRAGFAKAYVPEAAVWHSHDYTTLEQFRRCFDEWRALREVYGWREPASLVRIGSQLRGELARARDLANHERMTPLPRACALLDVGAYQLVRGAGALLGSRADRMPGALRGKLSLEGRQSFEPLSLGSREANAQDLGSREAEPGR
jgi:glycosyltransferase involved in cell wall biosynthesis